MRVIQKIRHSLGALSVILLTGSSCYAGINFGSQNSSLEILGNSSLRIPGSSMDVDEGTIKKVTASSILGGKVNFNNSIFFNNTTPMQINGVGDFGAIQEVSLSGNDDLFYSERGLVNQKVIVRGSRNRVEGSPHFTTANAIELHDHTVTLSIALASDLNQNLILNNGTLGLANNLKCADDVKLSGSGTVVLNGHQLTFGGKSLTYTDTILWKDAADLVMSNDIIVYGQWIFDGDSVINGGGNIIDISSGSTLWIRNNTTLNLNSVKIKGLGTGSLIFEDATSKIRMSYCDIQMDRDFTMTRGGIYVDGPSVIVTQDKTLTMSAQASMTVDHLALEYDTLDFGTQDNILPTKIDDPNQKYIAYLNNGVIRKRVTESLLSTHSNALLALTTNNSNALLSLTTNNSNALLALTRYNSNALLSCCANNSNALLQLTANNSNALLRLTTDNSNALLRLTTNNSNAIIAGEVGLAKYTSHALLYLIENESNALLSLFANTSNALLACCKNNSNALLRLTSNNSSAILNLDNMVRYVSNAELRLFKNNSDALLSLTTDNSNALLRLTTNNSNSLLACCTNNSNALLRLTANNSNALLRLTTNNSNAIIAGEVGLAKYTSHALLYLIENESNALLSLFANTSNALLACCKNNSNALLRLTSNNSSAILNLDNMVRYVSNAELRLFKNNSDALLSLTTDNSNALLSLTTNNSNSILYLQNLIGGGGGHIIIPGPTYTASRNIDVSSDSTVTVTGNVRFYGNGHVVDFGKSSANFIVNAGKFIVFENVILRNLASDSISLGAGANVVYGNGTCVEYNDTDNLSMNMTFSGTTLFEACCKRVKMDNSLIRVLPGGNLTVHGTLLDGLKGSNIRAEADWSTINFKNSQLYLSSDYSFTTGKILFEMDVEIAGTNKFVYAPTNAASKILAHSKLILDTGLTFSYSPSLANRDLLGMEDASSVLFLNGCSVHSTLTGMRLTKGTLFVDHKCQFFNPGATSMSQAIAFGDGTAANDLGIEIMPGGRIQVQSGQLAYQNTN